MNKTNKSIILTGVKAVNSNFNADFDGYPKEFPSPFALKYAIKSFWYDCGKNVFSMKSRVLTRSEKEESLSVRTFEQRYNQLFGDIKDESITQTALNLYNCIDTKTFGYINTIKKVSHGEKGIVQVSYGKNIYQDTNILDYEIISQFASGEGKDSTTIGNKVNVDFALYNYVLTVNPNATSHLFKENYESLGLTPYTIEDYNDLLEGIKYGVSNLNTVAKSGSTTSYVLKIDLKENKHFSSVDFSSMVSVKRNGDVAVLDFTKMSQYINEHIEEIDNFELFVDKYSQEVVGWDWEVGSL